MSGLLGRVTKMEKCSWEDNKSGCRGSSEFQNSTLAKKLAVNPARGAVYLWKWKSMSGQVAATCIYTSVTTMYGCNFLRLIMQPGERKNLHACQKHALIHRGAKCGALLWRMQKIMEKAWTVLGAESKRNGAEREHPIQFPNCAGSEYKHKGFITGRSLLKAGANSASSSTRRESSKHGRRGWRWREQQEDRRRNIEVKWHQEGREEDETRKNNSSYLSVLQQHCH